MKMMDYREKLGIGFNDVQKLKYLKSNCKTMLSSANFGTIDILSSSNLFAYCLNTGADFDIHIRNYAILHICYEPNSIHELVFRWVALTNAVQTDNKKVASLLLNILEEQLTDAKIPYELVKDKDGTFLFPKGAAELDKPLVNDVLIWLEKYPHTEAEYQKSLRLYAAEGEPRSVADQLRICLETFMREAFGANGNLEKLIQTNLGTFLKDKGIPYDFQKEVTQLVNIYRLYNDVNIKHQANADKRLLEFLLYQTGGIIRLIITLQQ